MTSPSGRFQSPTSNNNSNNANLCWLINANNYIRISFPYFQTLSGRDFLRIYEGNSTYSPLLLEASGFYVGGYHIQSVVSSTDQMLVVFTRDSKTNNIDYSRFEASYSSCSVLTSASGSISTPNYPMNYNSLENVCWIIIPPAGYVVTLSFKSFDTEPKYRLRSRFRRQFHQFTDTVVCFGFQDAI